MTLPWKIHMSKASPTQFSQRSTYRPCCYQSFPSLIPTWSKSVSSKLNLSSDPNIPSELISSDQSHWLILTELTLLVSRMTIRAELSRRAVMKEQKLGQVCLQQRRQSPIMT